MDRFEFPLPDIGEGVAEGEIVEWKVAVGDTVEDDQVLCEVMTDKATVEIPSPMEGKILELNYADGDVVPVGKTIVVIEPAEGAHIPTVARHGDHEDEDEEEPSSAEEPQESAAAEGGGNQGGTEKADVDARSALEIERPEGQRALATPYTRRLAREAGVDIERIKGNGEAGRVTPDDVANYVTAGVGAPAAAPAASAPAPAPAPAPAAAAAPAAPAPAPVAPSIPKPQPIPPGERETRVPIRGVRKKISEAMTRSKNTAAHFTYVDEVDVTELIELRRDLKPLAAEHDTKLTYLPFIMKACVSALRKFPRLNGVTDDAAGEFVIKHYYNLGIAVDTDGELIVPVVKGVDSLSLLQCAQEVARVAGDARDGRSKLEDLQDGTFTITNAGNIGGLFATPIINYPEAAIVGVHAIKQKPWVVDGEIQIRSIMYLSISIDHRMNDGAVGAHFMNHVVALLENPRRLMLEL